MSPVHTGEKMPTIFIYKHTAHMHVFSEGCQNNLVKAALLFSKTIPCPAFFVIVIIINVSFT